MPSSNAATASGFNGLTATVNGQGTYRVSIPEFGWEFQGNAGKRPANLQETSGVDSVGAYSEISFDVLRTSSRHVSIRVYLNTRAVLFTVHYPSASPNNFSFPEWSVFPKGLNHVTFSGTFAQPTFTDFSTDSPWTFFDASGRTFIISHASNFMTASTEWSSSGELASRISSKISSLPAGFEHQALLVMDTGINRAFDNWGALMTALHGKKRPANDADLSLRKVGYWTDNGANYYYKMAPSLSYQQTLASVKSGFDNAGIELGYVQLDSWFYPKGASAVWDNADGGIYQYVAATPPFTGTLAAVQQSIGVPLIVHARWIDSNSPYRRVYQMSGNVATDPAYWASVAGYLGGSGVTSYEQDWLNSWAQPAFNLSDADAFLDRMSAAMAQQGLTMQYCMGSPRHFMQSSKYSNLTTIRTSDDRFMPAHWTGFLYTSRLAGALGAWPFTDVFMSNEVSNLLLATLSAGPVGVGDAIGSLDEGNLLHAVRRDGVIVKPDSPVMPIDTSYQNAANGIDAPVVSSTYSDFGGGLRTHYVFAYPQGQNAVADFPAAAAGLDRTAYVYDYFGGSGRLMNPADQWASSVSSSGTYWIAAPIGPSGIAVLGDLGHFVSMGKQRITTLTDDGTVHLTVGFGAGDGPRLIQGYSPTAVSISASKGVLGNVIYDAGTQRFSFMVGPGAGGQASVQISRR